MATGSSSCRRIPSLSFCKTFTLFHYFIIIILSYLVPFPDKVNSNPDGQDKATRRINPLRIPFHYEMVAVRPLLTSHSLYLSGLENVKSPTPTTVLFYGGTIFSPSESDLSSGLVCLSYPVTSKKLVFAFTVNLGK